MSPETATTLTSRQRLTRGLGHTASGPVDVTRGVIGLSLGSARAGAVRLRRRYHNSRLAAEVAAAPEAITAQVAAAQEVLLRGGEALAGLPQKMAQADPARPRGWRPLVVGGVAAVLVVGGVAAVVLTRRSAQPVEPSPRPPSVDVAPKP